MEFIFIISCIFLVISVIIKGVTHVALDIRNGHKVEFARSKGYDYFLPYDKDVSLEDQKLKRLCNRVQKLFIFFLFIFIIVFLTRFIKK